MQFALVLQSDCNLSSVSPSRAGDETPRLTHFATPRLIIPIDLSHLPGDYRLS